MRWGIRRTRSEKRSRPLCLRRRDILWIIVDEEGQERGGFSLKKCKRRADVRRFSRTPFIPPYETRMWW